MSEFVVKLARWTDDTDRMRVEWLPGVKRVERLGTMFSDDAINAWVELNVDWSHVSIGEPPVRQMSLIWLETDSYSGPMVVEQAWLIGPSGGTVDRIHPTHGIARPEARSGDAQSEALVG